MAVARSAAAASKDFEPYKRVLGILLRPTCVSIAVSNEYLSQASPVGAVLLRDGRAPTRVLARMLAPYRSELTGVVWGHEVLSQSQVHGDKAAAAVLAQLQGVVQETNASLHAAWWEKWTPDTPASCRILPPGGPSAATAAHPTTTQPQGSGSSSAQAFAAAPQAGAPSSGGSAAGGTASGLTPLQASSPALAVSAGASGSPDAGAGAGGGAPCSMATLFLQHFLDSLGSQNTFG